MNRLSRNYSFILLRLLPFLLPTFVLRFSFFGIPTTVLEIYLFLLFFVFLFEYRWRGLRQGWEILRSWRWPVLAFVLITLISVFVSPNWFGGFGLWRAYILEPLLIFIIASNLLQTPRERDQIINSIFVVCILLFVWVIVQFATGLGIPHPWDVSILNGRRATGPFLYPNALSLFVAPIGALAFVRWIYVSDRKNKILTFCAWLSAFGSIILARSNGGFFGLFIACLFFLFLSRRTRWWTIVGCAVLFVAVVVSPFRDRVWKTVTLQEWSGQVRLFQWRETRDMLKDRWFFGAGFGGYPIVFKPYHRATAIEIFQYPHNIILNFWSETGLLGLFVFGWIVVKWLRIRSYFIAPLIAILVHGFVDVPYFKNDLAILFWLFVVLAIKHNKSIINKSIIKT